MNPQTQNQSDGSTIDRFCKNHGGYTATTISVFGGKKIYSPCPVCADETERRGRRDAEKEKEAKKAYKIKELMGQSGITKRFLSSSIENYRAITQPQKTALDIVQKYFINFQHRKEQGCSLVFCGLPGTGKTHLACAIGNLLIQECVSVVYSTVYKAIGDVKSTYNRNSEKSEYQVIELFKQPELLILDEVGVQFGTDAEKLILYQIINGRYENILPTIMISNLPQKDLSGYIGERCVDRFREGGGAVITFDWDSYRK